MTEILPMAFGREDLDALSRTPRSTSSPASATAALLDDAQIDWVIDAYTRGVVAEEQMAALAMAVLLARAEPGRARHAGRRR